MQKKGFTLVEVVISMAIVVIISVSMWSVMHFANVSFQKNRAIENAVQEIENVATVFYSSSNYDDFHIKLDKVFENQVSWVIELDTINFFISNNAIYKLSSSLNEMQISADIIFNNTTIKTLEYNLEKVVRV